MSTTNSYLRPSLRHGDMAPEAGHHSRLRSGHQHRCFGNGSAYTYERAPAHELAQRRVEIGSRDTPHQVGAFLRITREIEEQRFPFPAYQLHVSPDRGHSIEVEVPTVNVQARDIHGAIRGVLHFEQGLPIDPLP